MVTESLPDVAKGAQASWDNLVITSSPTASGLGGTYYILEVSR